MGAMMSASRVGSSEAMPALCMEPWRPAIGLALNMRVATRGGQEWTIRAKNRLIATIDGVGVRVKAHVVPLPGGDSRMRAHEISYFKLIEGDKQFQVPLYQRTYSWRQPEWTQLWDDILEQAELLATEQRTPHFIGSVVLAPGKMSAGDTQRWLVVDGQQRLTTLMVACCALRDRFREMSPRDGDRIHKQYLTNEFREGQDFYRLLPTQADRAAFIACVDQDPTAGGRDGVGAAYRFFRDALIDYDSEDDIAALKRLEVVLRSGLSIVEITAEQGDNVYRIFESLNNTGVRLGQTDLLRNYVFMLLPHNGERVYTKIWLPMQTELGADNLELLAWLDLVIRGDDRVKQSEVYRAQQRRLDEIHQVGGEEALEAEVAELRRRGRLLMRIVQPGGREQDPELRAVLERLQEWGGQISYPLALHLLDLLDRGEATVAEATRALTYLESFLVRRMICHITTSNLNRIVNGAPREMEADRPVDEAVHRYLSGPRRNWPSDQQLLKAILDAPFYWRGRANQRRFVLKRLEQSYEAPEPVDFTAAKLTIEHIMPQTATPEWLALLAEDVTDEGGPAELHSALLHTLGNLTLTAHNSALSNHPFTRKQEILDASALRMNREIADTPGWGKAQIQARGRALAERAIALWPAPLPGGADLEDERRTWVVLRRLLAEIPAGSWTTFGDLATVLGVPAPRVGSYLNNHPGMDNAHRVLTSEGTVSPAFRWPDDRTETARDVLAREGVPFSHGGVADFARRLGPADLAASIGMDTTDEEQADRFRNQLTDQGLEIASSVGRILDHWRARGGSLFYGSSAEVSCRLQFPLPNGGKGVIWPLLIYPQSGVIEMAFKPLSTRPPFDALELRAQLRDRLQRIEGVSVPDANLTSYPSLPFHLLTETGTERLLQALDWFLDTLQPLRNDPKPPITDPEEGLLAEFQAAMLSVYTRAKTEAGYNANQFLRMLTDHGGLATAKRLLANPRVSDGFVALYERKRLDLTVEAQVLDPKFAPLFTDEELRKARDWLTQFGYPA
ncbi:DUF262 domain-containing protein [Spirillospora sp. NPDC000708]